MKPVILIEEMNKYYNMGTAVEVRALEDISMRVDPNEYILVHGPSGSGKSTLLNVMATLDRPTMGRVFLFDRNLAGYSDTELSRMRQGKIGIVFQDFQLFQGLTAWENVALPLIPLGLGRRERCRRACSLLEELGLAARIGHCPEQMSGGEQQRVAIARALVNDPEILFADEPTSNIDQASTERLLDIFRDLQERGMTLIVTSHHPVFIEEVDRTVPLARGRIKERPA
jgi:putative ABC transport system ATP-binding protein